MRQQNKMKKKEIIKETNVKKHHDKADKENEA